MTLIRDLIAIPERVHSGDFVLQLSDGLTRPEETVRDYVVTPQLKTCFDDALAFIRSAIDGRKSKACYLHGSFGSGKSHFMAVLDLLLSGNLAARSIPELAEVVVRHNEWTQARRFLMVPYHMIGATSLDAAVLGQYAEHVRKLHPEAPVPGFYIAESMFEDARNLRTTLGDNEFFDRLNEGHVATGGSGWGKIAGGQGRWDNDSFALAMLEGPGGEERQRLIGDLIRQFFRQYATVAHDFVSLDDGLSIMSKHAKSLGYDAVILFLDELILWLATRAADPAFVSNEGAKLSKLVEAANADRPIPLISFVARQRDLRELVGDTLAGSLQLQFNDVLRWWEARFAKINLEDRNLPIIANKRVLRPVSEEARATLAEACDQTLKARQDVVETLLTSTGERDMFRLVYPFSPALVQTLIAVSSVLQRERTALKLMMQLLVDRRADLELGQLIPVGDLFDVLATGDDSFSDAMSIHFENAKKLWRMKLLPILERQHDIAWDQPEPADRARNLRNDARLLKTLLLAALVPEVESLKVLNAVRLAALNHGTVKSPIAGGEGRVVLQKLRGWAAEVGEIKISDGDNPTISVQITGVDTDPIIDYGRQYDNPGNRRRKIREALFQELGLEVSGDLFATFAFTWRGTRREILIGYDNVRELSDDRLSGDSDRWTVMFDYPFDSANYSSADDLVRLSSFRERGQAAAVLVWLPSFLSQKAQDELGRLIIVEELLKGDRFNEAARHLSPTDREQARSLLQNQRSQLQQRLRTCLHAAYGIENEPRDALGSSPIDPAQQVQSLDETFQPILPVGRDLKSALEQLLGQLHEYLFPAAPRFEAEVKAAVLKKVQIEVEKALSESEHRVLVADKGMRQLLLGVAGPLKLGTMGSTHLTLDVLWRQHFSRCQAADGVETITVASLRRWIDVPERMGLPKDAQDLIILTYAGQTNRTFFLRGIPFAAGLGTLADDAELREQALPPQVQWDEAVDRASKLFGLTIPRLLNAANAHHLTEEVRKKARDSRPAIDAYAASLATRQSVFGPAASPPSDVRAPARPAGTTNRSITAKSCQALLKALDESADDALIQRLAEASLQTSDTAMAQTISRAQALDEVLRGDAWRVFEALRKLSDERASEARTILGRLAQALGADEHVVALRSSIQDDHGKAVELLTASTTAQAPSPPPPSAPQPLKGRVIEKNVVTGIKAAEVRSVLTDLADRVAREPASRLDISWTLVRDED
ncbi:hypothetical protein [Magnetospirillum molischianum]|uniref:Putative phage resistance protein n=1 Tax=Magnetospirillum molischianum DSM 120 TaxID=1150626 RepID=H8FWN2_MAGML|nr:hypothetical protein [Magnetospirillum molischianum]CCG42770.1 putative phage resistance protein [Magnetospirillum molischianum DSM 120]